MNINVVELGANDQIMVTHCIGTLPAYEVDDYCKRVLDKLVKIFGKDKVALFPVREGDTWDFTIIRNV